MMKGTTKQEKIPGGIKKILTICFLAIVCLNSSFSIAKDQAPTMNEITVLKTENMIHDLNKSKDRKELINVFCTHISDWTLPSDEMVSVLNPNKSLFLLAFCGMVDSKYESNFKGLNMDIKKDKLDFDAIKAECEILEATYEKDYWNNVNFTCVTRKIHTYLMTDYINMVYYKAYGGFDQDIKSFVQIYFYDGEYDKSGEAKDNGTCPVGKYIQEGAPGNEMYCGHNKAYKELKKKKEDMDKNIIAKTNIIKGEDFIKSELWKDVWWPDDFEGFSNVMDTLYNELYFYNLFLMIRADYLTSDTSFAPAVVANNLETQTFLLKAEAIEASKEILYSQNATKISFRMLKNLERAWPIHIALVSIREDLIEFRKVLAKIYTPIHQLSYKLINAQELGEQ